MAFPNNPEILLQSNELAIGFNSPCRVLHKHINVTIKKGDFVCLLGPNGAGKSTLIRTLTGFLKPISGNVYVEGIQLSSISKQKLSKLISIVFTEKVMVPDMTVFDVVALGRSPYTGFFGKLSQSDLQKIDEALHDTGATKLKSRSIASLSDGELQKTMIAKALVQDTPLIILDEPTAFLDLPSRIETMDLLKTLALTKQKGILLSTHDLDLALRMADKIWLMASGRNMETGAPEDLILNNDFKRFFEKDGILFDNESGAFAIDRPHAKTIRLIGKGIEYKWVQRALTRNGFETTSHQGDYLQVEILSNGHREYQLKHPSGHSISFRTIEDLLARINHEENF
ncbi:MAG: ABC transporter ATP-binding protein [Breznakibacter sp.]